MVFPPDLAQEWLDPTTPKERAEAMVLHRGEPSEIFEWFPVSRDVGNVRDDLPGLIEPIGHPLVQVASAIQHHVLGLNGKLIRWRITP